MNGDFRHTLGTVKQPAFDDADLFELGRFMAPATNIPFPVFDKNKEDLTLAANHEGGALIEGLEAKLADSALSSIPAGFTYLGQFIDHDITFDSRSEREAIVDRPWNVSSTSDVENLRVPFFNLEQLYGSNNGRTAERDPDDDDSLLLSPTMAQVNANQEFLSDLPRNNDGIAVIVDRRNDENLLVAQVQVMFSKLHNSVVRELRRRSVGGDLFERAKKIMIRHYQKMIHDDFLPRFVDDDAVEEVKEKIKSGSESFFKPSKSDPYLPIEFSVGAFRICHSMIRNSYSFNRLHQSPKANLHDLFRLTRKRLGSSWIPDWRRFFELGEHTPENFNFAKAFTVQFASLLGSLPKVKDGDEKARSLASLDLVRANSRGIASGELIATEMRNYYDVPEYDPDLIASHLPENLRERMRRRTPFLFYLLAESEISSAGAKFGRLGGLIFGETILRLLAISPHSISEVPLGEDDDLILVDDPQRVEMRDLLGFIARNSPETDELNLLG